MTLRFRFSGDDIGRRLEQELRGRYGEIADASRAAMTEAADEIKERGDADIKKAGNFGQRWLDSFVSRVEPIRGRTVNLLVNVFHRIPYANIHERGGVIRGKPLLWIPLSYTGLKIRAREYARRYGLFYVERKDPSKKPLLLSKLDKEPKYVGVESVRLRKRFHITQITRDVARKLPDMYARAYRRVRRNRR